MTEGSGEQNENQPSQEQSSGVEEDGAGPEDEILSNEEGITGDDTAEPGEDSSMPGPENQIEPHKRLGEAEPEELAYAFEQVFKGGEERPYSAQSKIANARPKTAPAVKLELLGAATASGEQQGPETSSEKESKSGYNNAFSLFADVFYGMLVAPRPTLAILSDCKRFPPTAGNLLLTLVMVVGALSIPAAIKAGANDWSTMGWLKGAAFIAGNLCNWCILALVLYYLGIWLRGHKLTPGNAFIATGWAYLPFAFFAPVACFKSAMGGGFTLFACLPALWFLVLEWFAFQVSLRTSAVKLALIAFVVPPVFCLVYLFWIGLAVVSVIAQLVSHLA